MNLRPIIFSTDFATEWRLLLQNIPLKRKILSQTDDFIATESSLLITSKSFYDNRFLVHNPVYSIARGKWLLHQFLLYTQCFRENITTIQILKKGVSWKPPELSMLSWKFGTSSHPSCFSCFVSKASMLTLPY